MEWSFRDVTSYSWLKLSTNVPCTILCRVTFCCSSHSVYYTKSPLCWMTLCVLHRVTATQWKGFWMTLCVPHRVTAVHRVSFSTQSVTKSHRLCSTQSVIQYTEFHSATATVHFVAPLCVEWKWWMTLCVLHRVTATQWKGFLWSETLCITTQRECYSTLCSTTLCRVKV